MLIWEQGAQRDLSVPGIYEASQALILIMTSAPKGTVTTQRPGLCSADSLGGTCCVAAQISLIPMPVFNKT